MKNNMVCYFFWGDKSKNTFSGMMPSFSGFSATFLGKFLSNSL